MKDQRLLKKVAEAIEGRFDSSTLDKYKYNPDTQTLELSFKPNGATYEYSGVTQNVFDGLLTSDSQGSFFYHNIRNIYPTRRK